MKNIIVVTGASSGLGESFAIQISELIQVDEIWLIARHRDRLEETASKLKVPARILTLDLAKQKEIKKYGALLKKEKARVDILANCVGFGKLNHYENENLKTYMNMVDLNVKGYMAMIHYSLPYMRRGSKIMNIASSSAFQPLSYANVYASTKAFVLSYSRALNRELKYRGIHVLAVCPYWVRTQFYDRAIDPDTKRAVIRYGCVTGPDEVIQRAICDLFSKKDVSTYGFMDKGQRIFAKLLPHSFIMKVWMLVQKQDGTPGIRKI